MLDYDFVLIQWKITLPITNQHNSDAFIIVFWSMCTNNIESTTFINFTITTDCKTDLQKKKYKKYSQAF